MDDYTKDATDEDCNEYEEADEFGQIEEPHEDDLREEDAMECVKTSDKVLH